MAGHLGWAITFFLLVPIQDSVMALPMRKAES